MQIGRGSKEPNAAKPRKRAKKDDTSKPPASTDISSPVAPRSRKKTGGKAAGSTDMGSLELTRNGYERDDFVIDSEDDEYFEPVPKRRKSNNGQATESPGSPLLKDIRLESLPEIHQEVVQNFVSEAKRLEESIRNNSGLRRPLFSEQNFQDMAIHWTTTPAAMHSIRGIDQTRVDKYGNRFAKMVRDFHEQYLDMMGIDENFAEEVDRDIVDLISSDLEADFDVDLEEDGGEESRFFSAPMRPPSGPGPSAVQDWHQRLNQASQNPPDKSGSGSRSASESGGRGSRKGFRGGKRGGKKGGGVSKRRASGGGISKTLYDGRGSKGGGSSSGKGGKGGRGGGRGGGSSAVGLMPF